MNTKHRHLIFIALALSLLLSGCLWTQPIATAPETTSVSPTIAVDTPTFYFPDHHACSYKMFSLGLYPISSKDGIPLCEVHGRQLEMKEVVVFDPETTKEYPATYCWVCCPNG
jgi:hypothetical protein